MEGFNPAFTPEHFVFRFIREPTALRASHSLAGGRLSGCEGSGRRACPNHARTQDMISTAAQWTALVDTLILAKGEVDDGHGKFHGVLRTSPSETIATCDTA